MTFRLHDMDLLGQDVGLRVLPLSDLLQWASPGGGQGAAHRRLLSPSPDGQDSRYLRGEASVSDSQFFLLRLSSWRIHVRVKVYQYVTGTNFMPANKCVIGSGSVLLSRKHIRQINTDPHGSRSTTLVNIKYFKLVLTYSKKIVM